MEQLEQIVDWEIDKIVSAGNRRGAWSEEKIRERAQNIAAVGLREPVEGYREGDLLYLIDGHGRLEAEKLNGKKTIRARVVAKPSKVELVAIQASKDLHHETFPMGAKCRAAAEWKSLANISTAELARQASLSPSMATKMITTAGGHPCLTEMLDRKELCIEKSFDIVTATSDHAKQQEWAMLAKGLSREQVKRMVKPQPKQVIKGSSVRIALPGQYVLTLKGPALDMPTFGEVLQEAYRQVRKAEKAGHDISSVQRLLSGKP